MIGNATFRHDNTALLAVTSVEAPVVVSSAAFDERLAPSLKRLRLSKRLLERVAGVSERRWWAPGTSFDEAAIEAELYTAGQPNVDLLIRTSGEKRLSNFLPWQLAYAEMVFDPVLWPDFDRAQYLKDLREYAARDRRFGGVKKAASIKEQED